MLINFLFCFLQWEQLLETLDGFPGGTRRLTIPRRWRFAIDLGNFRCRSRSPICLFQNHVDLLEAAQNGIFSKVKFSPGCTAYVRDDQGDRPNLNNSNTFPSPKTIWETQIRYFETSSQTIISANEVSEMHFPKQNRADSFSFSRQSRNEGQPRLRGCVGTKQNRRGLMGQLMS